MKRTASVFVAVAVVSCLAGTGLTARQTPSPTPVRKYAPLVRGIAELACLKPTTKVQGDVIVTVLKVKNMSKGTIAGLQVDEYWWDKANAPIAGGRDRLKKPLTPGEEATLTVRTPKNPKMFRNQYQFRHDHGTIKVKTVDKFN